MEPPTISKKQSKKTLSGKKKKKETIKNVLAQPYQCYWPLLTPEDNNHLKETLSNTLPRIQNPKINVPFEEIKKIPKGERRNFREKYLQQPPIETSVEERRSVVFGVNETNTLLENREAGCVLIAHDVQPRLLVQHIIDQAVLYNVPVLVVENLRDLLTSKCGVKSAVFALKKTLSSDSNLELIQQIVSSLSENYPVPETHINYHRRLDFDVSTITISDADSDVKDSVVSVSDEEADSEERKNYHLKRKSKTERAFVPEKSRKIDENAEIICLDDTVAAENGTISNNTEMINLDESSTGKSQKIDESVKIICLDDTIPAKNDNKINNLDDSDTASFVKKGGKKKRKNDFVAVSTSKKAKIAKKQHYTPLKVKRIKGDKNRNKRKMEKFKKKNNFINK